jgi:hypothetical protein
MVPQVLPFLRVGGRGPRNGHGQVPSDPRARDGARTRRQEGDPGRSFGICLPQQPVPGACHAGRTDPFLSEPGRVGRHLCNPQPEASVTQLPTEYFDTSQSGRLNSHRNAIPVEELDLPLRTDSGAAVQIQGEVLGLRPCLPAIPGGQVTEIGTQWASGRQERIPSM